MPLPRFLFLINEINVIHKVLDKPNFEPDDGIEGRRTFHHGFSALQSRPTDVCIRAYWRCVLRGGLNLSIRLFLKR